MMRFNKYYFECVHLEIHMTLFGISFMTIYQSIFMYIYLHTLNVLLILVNQILGRYLSVKIFQLYRILTVSFKYLVCFIMICITSRTEICL